MSHMLLLVRTWKMTEWLSPSHRSVVKMLLQLFYEFEFGYVS